MINILLSGITGRMGREVLNAVANSEDLSVVAGVNNSEESDIENIPVYTDINMVKEKVDVIVDFSKPAGTMKALEYAKEKSLPIVIATTGFDEAQEETISEYSKVIPVFKSSNMSYEINVMCEVVSELAKKFSDCDIEIVETHHRNKVDSPSGTALMIANSINKALDNEMEFVFDRHSVRQKRGDREIGISSIRGGTEAGKHTVMFLGNNESFEITHNVTSRSVFANGALKATRFIVNQALGLYNMKNL